MSLSRQERILLHKKAQTPLTGEGAPSKLDGKEGDVAYRRLSGVGIVHYIKRNGEWQALSSTDKMPAERATIRVAGGTGAGITDHGGMSGIGDDDHTQYLLVDGTRAMTTDITIGDDLLFSSSGAVIDWNSSDLTLTHSANTLTLAGGTLAAAAITGQQIQSSVNWGEGWSREDWSEGAWNTNIGLVFTGNGVVFATTGQQANTALNFSIAAETRSIGMSACFLDDSSSDSLSVKWLPR